ncbi:type VI secretion system baseplate subunit TssF [Caulobacter flavus]|uniref:Type VI secretion system baseplate subunit TssF n=2 Tax=Caulobacter flavus TaxID=1679497 RepID=A0A2N5CZD8_9CAUL|nr:type VI secretion system baseplate subunit TssF [Caulobacter flavus]AYV45143.1 type VI secretion system baseplate subunit TssF [Caulobacter flavus]PLR19177.1 type VI secretion system baseplate subunit TssF [Caulobacter flavus]
MDPRMLGAYNKELDYLRDAGKEFGQENQEVAGRLGLGNREETDPYVERLLEGVAFLSARVQLKLEDQFPEFTQQLLQSIQPDYLAPTPSMCIAMFAPTEGGAPSRAVTIKRHTQFTAETIRADSPCTFSTAHEVKLLPIAIEAVEYLSNPAPVAAAAAFASKMRNERIVAQAGVRIRLKAVGDLKTIEPGLMPIFIDGTGSLPGTLYHQMMGEALAVVAYADADPARPVLLPKPVAVGLREDEALLPSDGRSFGGYRLLREYFTFPERFMFFAFQELERAFAVGGSSCELIVLFNTRADPLEGVSVDNLRLFCTPAINLFEKSLGLTRVRKFEHEHLVVPDRGRPDDFEVFRVLDVKAHLHNGDERPVAPIYAFGSLLHDWSKALFRTTRMRPRRLSRRQQQSLGRGDYSDTETLISLSAPGDPELLDTIRDLSIRALVTNRELPELLSEQGDVQMRCAEDTQVRIVRGPTRPRPPLGLGDSAWRVVGGLTANHASMVSQPGGHPGMLRDHIGLYGAFEGTIDGAAARRQIDGILRVTSETVQRRIVSPPKVGSGRGAAMAFVRGQRVRIVLDDTGYDRGRIFLFASVLDRFLSEFATVNTFIETVFESQSLGEFATWPPKMGLRPTI